MLHYARPLDIMPSEAYVHVHSHHHAQAHHWQPHFSPTHHQQQQQQQQQQHTANNQHQHHYARPDTAGSTGSSHWDPTVSPLSSAFDERDLPSPPFAYGHPLDALPSDTLALNAPSTAVPPQHHHSSHTHHHNTQQQQQHSAASPGAGDDFGDDANKTYSFVSLPGNAVKKRPRRRYDEIERLYACNFPGCAKAYGTLNHLNAHIVMQRHGPKRTPAEFKELRKQWRKAKKDDAERAARMSVHPGSLPQPHDAHVLAQHASLPNLHYPSYAHHAHQAHAQAQAHPYAAAAVAHHQPSAFRPAPAAEFFGLPPRRHSVGDPYAPLPMPAPAPSIQAPTAHPHPHGLTHSLSSASLSSTSQSHMSLSPPLEYAEPPAPSAHPQAWHSRAQAQGWDTPYASTSPTTAAQYDATYEHHHAGSHPGSGGHTPFDAFDGRASPGTTAPAPGSLPPDSTLLAPLSIPGYVAPLAEEGAALSV